MCARPKRFATDDDWREWKRNRQNDYRDRNRTHTLIRAAGDTAERQRGRRRPRFEYELLRDAAQKDLDREEREMRLKGKSYICSPPKPHEKHPSSRPPPELIEEADRAYHTPRSLTATLMGDPPFGRSALERAGR